MKKMNYEQGKEMTKKEIENYAYQGVIQDIISQDIENGVISLGSNNLIEIELTKNESDLKAGYADYLENFETESESE